MSLIAKRPPKFHSGVSLKRYLLSVRVRIIKFGMVGAVGTAVDWGLVIGLTEAFKESGSTALLQVLIPSISYELGVFVNYLLCRFWAWRDRRGNFWKQCLRYHLSYIATFLLRLGLFNAATVLINVNVRDDYLRYYVLFFASCGVAVVLNFLLVDTQVFRGGSQALPRGPINSPD